jgi:hypothetical protein
MKIRLYTQVRHLVPLITRNLDGRIRCRESLGHAGCILRRLACHTREISQRLPNFVRRDPLDVRPVVDVARVLKAADKPERVLLQCRGGVREEVESFGDRQRASTEGGLCH